LFSSYVSAGDILDGDAAGCLPRQPSFNKPFSVCQEVQLAVIGSVTTACISTEFESVIAKTASKQSCNVALAGDSHRCLNRSPLP
jgi:hypothetical protein